MSRILQGNQEMSQPKEQHTDLAPLFTGSSFQAHSTVHLSLFLFSSQTVTGLGSDAGIYYLTAIFLNISSLHLKLPSSSVFI